MKCVLGCVWFLTLSAPSSVWLENVTHRPDSQHIVGVCIQLVSNVCSVTITKSSMANVLMDWVGDCGRDTEAGANVAQASLGLTVCLRMTLKP